VLRTATNRTEEESLTSVRKNRNTVKNISPPTRKKNERGWRGPSATQVGLERGNPQPTLTRAWQRPDLNNKTGEERYKAGQP